MIIIFVSNSMQAHDSFILFIRDSFLSNYRSKANQYLLIELMIGITSSKMWHNNHHPMLYCPLSFLKTRLGPFALHTNNLLMIQFLLFIHFVIVPPTIAKNLHHNKFHTSICCDITKVRKKNKHQNTSTNVLFVTIT